MVNGEDRVVGSEDRFSQRRSITSAHRVTINRGYFLLAKAVEYYAKLFTISANQ